MKFKPNPDLKLMDQVGETLRYYHYVRSTEKTYCQRILCHIYFYDKNRYPKDMGTREVECFFCLTWPLIKRVYFDSETGFECPGFSLP